MKHLSAALFLALATAFASGASHAQPAVVPDDVAAAQASSVSADAAQAALVRGATAVDIRDAADYLAGHLPGAISVPGLAFAVTLDSVQTLVSRHGIDLSREVVIVGRPGDLQALRLQALLGGYATGRVTWLVGGVHEWALSGRPLEQQAAVLPPVPQYLVPLQPQPQAPRMAGAHLRDLAQYRPAVTASAF